MSEVDTESETEGDTERELDVDTEWEQLIACPHDIVSNAILVNRHEILFIASMPLRLITYDTIIAQWNELMSLPDEIEDDLDDELSICVDNITHKVYVYGGTKIFKVDVCAKCTHIVHRAPYEFCVGTDPFALFVNDTFHLFAGSTSDKHYIYDKNKDKMEVNHSFKNEEDGDKRCISGHHVLHLSKKDIIIMMGGYDDYGWETMDKIYCYECKVKKWRLLDLKMPVEMDRFGCIATKDDKYIITFCGEDSSGNGVNSIYIFDMDTMTVYLSSITCPIDGFVYAILADDERMNKLIVTAYIKSIWKSNDFNEMIFPCQDILNFIAVWYGGEYVYLMQRMDPYKHYRIWLDDILCSEQRLMDAAL